MKDSRVQREYANWPTRPFGDYVADARNGTYVPSDSGAEVVPIVKILNITTDGFWALDRLDLAPAGHLATPDNTLRNGDLLFARVNSADQVGKVALVDARTTGLIFEAMTVRVTPDPGRLLPAYAHAVLSSSSGRDYFRARARRIVGMASINQADIAQFRMPIPPISEQLLLIQEMSTMHEILGRVIDARSLQLAAVDALPASLLRSLFHASGADDAWGAARG
jgi:type I restriction enzyme S subunit